MAKKKAKKKSIKKSVKVDRKQVCWQVRPETDKFIVDFRERYAKQYGFYIAKVATVHEAIALGIEALKKKYKIKAGK